MKVEKNSASEIKIAYIGGGSRGWAWNLMSDLAQEKSLSGEVCLYDIDLEAAKANEIIGNKIREVHKDADNWYYTTAPTLCEALTGANFIIISILPGTFDEMRSDVHAPEEFGIYQSVGDTTGPGGIIRALRTVPMYEVIAAAIRDYAPDAWVINYTNPMAMCVRTLYRVFPKIKAFGCCHEVFGTQKFLAKVMQKALGCEEIDRSEIKANVIGTNHFTWLTSAHFRNHDIFPYYEKFCEEYGEKGFTEGNDTNWLNRVFQCAQKVKMDLFKKYGYIAAAGDRHLAEFCPGTWYLDNPETVKSWGFDLTSVDFRLELLADRMEKSRKMVSGEQEFELNPSGEEGVIQIKALLGLGDLVTNVNLPNYGQIPNLPLGAVVETNASFTADSVTPVFAGAMPQSVLALSSDPIICQEMTVEAALTRNLDLAFSAFAKDPQVTKISRTDSKKLFDKMIANTADYLTDYKI